MLFHEQNEQKVFIGFYITYFENGYICVSELLLYL